MPKRGLAGQFAAATMHEVNGRLEAISNFNYLLQANSNDGEQVRNYSGLIEEQLSSRDAFDKGLAEQDRIQPCRWSFGLRGNKKVWSFENRVDRINPLGD